MKRVAMWLIILPGCVVLSGCPASIPPSPAMAVANCPKLTPLRDDTFAATTEKLVEVAGIYYACRAAAGVK